MELVFPRGQRKRGKWERGEMKEKYEWIKMDKSELCVSVLVESLTKAVDMDSWENRDNSHKSHCFLIF